MLAFVSSIDKRNIFSHPSNISPPSPVALFALIQQPPYQGATNIVSLTAAELRSRVMRVPKIVEINDEGKTVPEGAAKHYIVLIWAPWSIACLNFEGVMADLSLE